MNGDSDLQPGSEANKKWHDLHGEKTLRQLLAEEEPEDDENEPDIFDPDYLDDEEDLDGDNC